MSDTEKQEIEGVAIIGMAGRFPRARSVDEFWRNLRDGVECVSFFTEQELEEEGVDPSLLAAPGYVKAKGMLDDIELFDAAFFGITPAEAESMDPQQRLFLESAWEALENAGYDPGRYKGAISVFAGVSLNSYLMLNLLSSSGLIDSVGVLQASIRNRTDHLATRASYKLNLKGASVTVQTACSTSLVAVHLASRSLLDYECDIALAGGVTVSVPKKSGYLFQEGGVFSQDGHCRAFDAEATGTVNGNGVGIVVLKRLSEALADGDYIHGVIRGSAINNDGAEKVGYTSPSVGGQADVIAMAQAVAGVQPETISYVEAHGTGTALGDPVEVAALAQVFGSGAGKKSSCALGSVKSNIGHLDVAAGVAGLIKTVMALKHRELPPSLNFKRPNPQIDFDNTPFYVNDRLTPWEAGDAPRRAGISSFGIGGTNAHVVVEEAPARAVSGRSRPSQLLLLSAKTSAALETATANLSLFFREHTEVHLADAAYTLQVGRKSFGHRRMVVCSSVEDAAQSLEALDPRRVVTGVQEPMERPVVFMFPGQGAQYANMGRELYETEEVFREQVDFCARHLAPLLGLDLRDVLYPNQERLAECEELLGQTALTQPALFVVEYALSQLLARWGVRPHAMIGHSIGEYVAACLAGVFSPEEALALVAARGRVMQSAERGSMLMVQLPEREVLPLLGRQLSLASVNAPSMCVVAGPAPAIEGLASRLGEKGVLCRPLHTSHAFHSAMMEPILGAFAAEVKKVRLNAPSLPFVSNLTGTWITAAEATDPDYWVRHLRQTVRFGDGLAELFKEPDSVLLEVGPSRTLMTIARWHPSKAAGQTVVTTLPHPEKRDADLSFLLHSLGRLWLSGVEVNWGEFYAGESRQRIPLPAYPFERRRYWIDGRRQGAGGAGRQALRRKADIADWFYVPSWKRSAPPAFAEAMRTADRDTCCLMFLDRCGIGAQVGEELRRAGLDVVTVEAGENFIDDGGGGFTINPRRREEYAELLNSLERRGQKPTVIAHLWGVARGGETGAAVESEDETLDTGFYSLLALAQALGEQSGDGPLQINVVTSGMQQVAGDEELSPAKATVLGPCKVIPQEYRHITCRSIDLALPEEMGRGERKLVESLAAEFVAPSPDKVIAYRHGHRWTQTFEPHRLEGGAQESARLRQEGVYLITGGIGGIGLVLAEHLARSVRARLVLLGRSALPERAEWPQWLAAHGEQDATSRKIRKVQELEALGAQVMTASADVSDFGRMRQVVSEALERFGQIDGVIHAAGVPGGGMIQLKTRDDAAAILAPKVQGARVLGDLFRNQSLDFMLLCSSRSAILGGFGQVDYCAANAFLDAFAHQHSSRSGTFTVSINWDGWQQVGMLVDTAARYAGGAEPPRQTLAETGHPLLGSLVSQTEEREMFVTQFSVDKQWILEEHRIAGTSVLPGVTYLEMARAAFERHAGGRAVEIREVFFLSPMSIKDNETRDVRFVLEKSGDGFKFHASSKTSRDNGSNPKWQEHALGYVGPATRQGARRYDLDELIKRCGEREAVVADEEKDPDLGPRWQNIQKVYIGKGEILVLFELDEMFNPDFEKLKLHPSLLDRAAGTGMIYIEGIEGLYLPLSYKRLSVWRPLARKIYAHIRYKDDEDPGKETVTFDVNIMGADGSVLVEIEGFSEKRINDLTVRVKAMAEAGAAAGIGLAEGPESPGDKSFYQESIEEGITPKDGAEAFARILAAATLPQVVVSTRDLHASIERADAFTQSRVSEEIEKLQASRPLHPRPDLQTTYAPPRDEAERLLTEILQGMLGIEQVGVNDNYFELGGDSVLAIQIIAKAGRAGLHLTPQQIFQHQTVAEMAAVAKRAQPVEAEQGVVTGPVPLTPIQHWFFEQNALAPERVCQTTLLRTREALDASVIERAVRELAAHHDALRLCFTRDESGWRQEHAALEESGDFRRVDVSKLSESERASIIRRTADELPSEFDLARGPLARFVYFDAGAGVSGHLLIAIHRLLVDDRSWRILLEDLEQACDHPRSGERPQLPRKTTSFKRWAERLQAHAASDAVKAEAGFWTDTRYARAARLPADQRSGANTLASGRTVVVSLGPEETRALQQEVPQTYHAQPSDLLLTALAQTLTRWCGAAFLFHSEGPGRETLLEGVELTRTVGWFAELFPTLLELKQDETPGQALKSVKEQLRQVPNWGTGYGLLRYLSDDAGLRERLRGFPRPEVFVSFRPSSDNATAAHSLFEVVPRSVPSGADAQQARSYLLEIKVFDAGGYLQSEWTYSENVHRRETVEQLADDFLEALRALIAHSAHPDAEGYTPSDFPLAALNEETFSKLRSLLAEPEE
jgi:non-ribosomal peptide synthase protein (TIGR01720 family)